MNSKRLQFMGLFFLAFILNACAQTGTQSSVAEAAATTTVEPTRTPLPPTSTPLPNCSAEAEPGFATYASWTKVNPKPIQGHEVWVNIYVDDLARKTYLAASGEAFPVCSRIVKTQLEDAESQSISAITVMVKMPPGYDPQHNDWWWGLYDDTGSVAEMKGKVSVCIECHQSAADDDYVFSKTVMAESAQK